MKIRDVAELTGLTAKSIRYYEAKGLLEVQRDADNSYRNYTEENVSELKRIKLYRYLGFSIEEIRDLLDKNPNELKIALQEKAEEYAEQREGLEIKRNICMALSRDGASLDHVIDGYGECIRLMEEDGANVLETLKDLKCPTLAETIAVTLMFLGPVLWLFVNIHEKKWDSLMINSILVIAGSAFTAIQWQRYFLARKNTPKRVEKVEKEYRYYMFSTIIGLIAGFAVCVGLSAFVEAAFAPQDWLFYEKPGWAENLLFICALISSIYIVNGLLDVYRLKKAKKQGADIQTDFPTPFGIIRKGWFVIVPILAFLFYISIVNVYYVTEHQIVVCTTLCPQGKVYEYQDVSEIQTGFGQKLFSIHSYDKKGNFYYKIIVDGKTLVFSQPSVNEIDRYEEDTYLELEEFDRALVQLGIPKKGSDKGRQNVDLDKTYVERFCRIIANK